MAPERAAAAAFDCPGALKTCLPYGSGHINDTYRVVFDDSGREMAYILQRINHEIFLDVPALMENVDRVTRHQHRRLTQEGSPDADRRALRLIPAHTGKTLHRDDAGRYWRMYVFVTHSRGIDVVESPAQARAAAYAFGDFQRQLADLPDRLHETIPRFHHTRSRFDDFAAAVDADPLGRCSEVRDDIAFALQRESLTDVVVDLLARGEVPERVTHNDTKLNNVLFDERTDEALCVIDLDTVMQGSMLYDFGDLVRTSTTRVPEDEQDLSRVRMEIEYFEALTRGYLEAAGDVLVQREKDLLALSGRLISFEIGLRFLTDYLSGDVYFKTDRPGQNIDRCRKQFAMLRSMEDQSDAMQKIVEDAS